MQCIIFFLPVPVRLPLQALVTCVRYYRTVRSVVSEGQHFPVEKVSCTRAQSHMSEKSQSNIDMFGQGRGSLFSLLHLAHDNNTYLKNFTEVEL